MTTLRGITLRAGQIFCACDMVGLPRSAEQMPTGFSLVRMAFAFGLGIVAQILTLSVLPLASASMAPTPNALALPYVAMLIGAALSTFPASILLDLFGRRAAFALGASLGIAGGAIAAWAIMERQFGALLLGVAWLGMAQGFGLFYRHAGAMLVQGGSGIIFGAGAIAAIVGPTLLTIINAQAGALAPAYALITAGLVHFFMLGIAVTLPAQRFDSTRDATPTDDRSILVAATAIAALAWFGMTSLMARTPLMMAGCGIGFSLAAGVMALHIAAMYLPGFIIGRWLSAWGGFKVGLGGLVLLGFGALLVSLQREPAGFGLALSIAGAGWGIATIGATEWLHRKGNPSPMALAIHDGLLFIAAIIGALTV